MHVDIPYISTHAPAGGATTAVSESFAIMGIFLLTPRKGLSRPAKKFLLTPLREGRRKASSTSLYHELFLLTPLREGRPAAF